MESSTYEFRLPDIGEGVSEGEIVAWHVQKGQPVAEDQPMLDVMTDKVTVTIGAPRAGVIDDVRAEVGQTVQVGTVVVVIRENAGGARRSQAPDTTSQQETKASAVGDIRESLPGTAAFQKHSTQGRAQPSTKVLATPATRKLARDMGVDLRQVQATGEDGRVRREDVLRLAGGTHEARPIESSDGASGRVLSDGAMRSRNEQGIEQEIRKPFVGLRRKIAERMQTAKRTAAHFTFVEECDVSELKRLRERLQSSAALSQHKLNYLPFIVKAVVLALKKHPVINSALDETKGELVTKQYYHMGIATATDQGLVVPVLRHADRRSVLDIGHEIARLASGARAGTLTPYEMSGSTFTITSLGQLGGLMATPVLNMPEVGILGVHRIKERPVVRDGQIAIGHVMNLSLTLDHRIVDGHIGASFTYDVIRYLEDPGTLLLELT